MTYNATATIIRQQSVPYPHMTNRVKVTTRGFRKSPSYADSLEQIPVGYGYIYSAEIVEDENQPYDPMNVVKIGQARGHMTKKVSVTARPHLYSQALHKGRLFDSCELISKIGQHLFENPEAKIKLRINLIKFVPLADLHDEEQYQKAVFRRMGVNLICSVPKEKYNEQAFHNEKLNSLIDSFVETF